MNILNKLTRDLVAADIDTARIDAIALIAHVTKASSANVVAGNFSVSADELTHLDKLNKRRAAHEPLAYILGHKEFYGRDFIVNEHTLIPRSESEDMVHLALQLGLKDRLSLLDIGAGSGILGITYYLEAMTPQASGRLELMDISQEALDISKQNADKFQLSTSYQNKDFRKLGDLNDYDLVFANLPYVPTKNKGDLNQKSPGLAYEPDIALYAGSDGLDLYRDLLSKSFRPGAYLIVEALEGQHKELLQLAKSNAFELYSSGNLALCLKKS